MARQDLYILKRGEAAIGLEGFVIVLDQYVLLLSLEYAEPSCHYLIGSTLGISMLLHPIKRKFAKGHFKGQKRPHFHFSTLSLSL